MAKVINYRLREARERRGWSQERVAEQIGTTMVNVSRWERGYSTPSPYFREKLCQLYGKEAQELGFLKHYEQKELVQQTTSVSEPVPTFLGEPQNISDKEKPNRTSRILACSGYLFLWISGVFVFLFAGEDHFARFHSLQSTLFFGGSNLVSGVILALLGAMLKIANNDNRMILTISFMFLFLVFVLINLFTLVGWVVGIVQAWRGNYYSFPFIRSLKERTHA
jgi:uncharacterized membrane protein/DNA-binding XRE family transcriptional regulator